MPIFRVVAPPIYVDAPNEDAAVEVACEHWESMPDMDFEIEEQD